MCSLRVVFLFFPELSRPLARQGPTRPNWGHVACKRIRLGSSKWKEKCLSHPRAHFRLLGGRCASRISRDSPGFSSALSPHSVITSEGSHSRLPPRPGRLKALRTKELQRRKLVHYRETNNGTWVGSTPHSVHLFIWVPTSGVHGKVMQPATGRGKRGRSRSSAFCLLIKIPPSLHSRSLHLNEPIPGCLRVA